MKLFFSAASPYVRKVMVLAHEAGLADRIELLDAAASPIKRDGNIVAHNPMGKVPTMVIEDGRALYDSRVICEYLDALHSRERMFPADPGARSAAITLQALADGLLDAAILARYEATLRPEALRWAEWVDGQMAKITAAVDTLETSWAEHLESRLDIGTIATACALGYLDFRFADHDWRTGHDRLAAWYRGFTERASMQATQPG